MSIGGIVRTMRCLAPLACAALVGCGSTGSSGGGNGADGGGRDGSSVAPACAVPEAGVAVTLASGQGSVAGIAVDSDAVYWSDETSAISKTSLCGGPVTVLAPAGTGGLSLALDSDHVYFASETSVQRVPKSGGTPAPVYELSGGAVDGGAWISALAVDGTTVYVGVAGPAAVQTLGSPESASIVEIPVAGGSGTNLATNVATPTNLALDSSHLYFSDVTDSIDAVPLDGGAVSNLSPPGAGQTNGLAVAGGSVYWSTALHPATSPPPTAMDAMMQRVPVTGGTPQPVATGFDFVGAAVDGAAVYWLDIFAQAVESVGLDGGSVQTVVSSEPAAVGPVVDEISLYWATSDGRIRRALKAAP